jgi:hypothetical protein
MGSKLELDEEEGNLLLIFLSKKFGQKQTKQEFLQFSCFSASNKTSFFYFLFLH